MFGRDSTVSASPCVGSLLRDLAELPPGRLCRSAASSTQSGSPRSRKTRSLREDALSQPRFSTIGTLLAWSLVGQPLLVGTHLLQPVLKPRSYSEASLG